jgi:hypothetical protein
MAARRKYEEFHGRPVRYVKDVRINVPEKLIRLGRATAIEYECSKFNGGGDGKRAVYRHEFETPCDLAMDESGRRQLYIIGHRLRVTEAGIEN